MQTILAFTFDFSQLSLGWIDFVTVIVILLGLHLGNRTGASKQILSFASWLVVLLLATVGHLLLGKPLAALFDMEPWKGALIAYVSIASIVAISLAMITRRLADRVEASTAFGKMEYVIGPAACMIRNLAILLLVLSTIHGLDVSPVAEERDRKEQMHNYGMMLYPTKGMIRSAVFDNSTTGKLTERYLGFLMVDPDRPMQQASLR